VLVVNTDVTRPLRIPDAAVQAAAARERRELERRERAYRGTCAAPALWGRTVILVDDGLATGSTMRAAVGALRQERAARGVVAVPVGSRRACGEFRDEVDETVCAETPEDFAARRGMVRRFLTNQRFGGP
jgi:putative phosphoribosyl transferase